MPRVYWVTMQLAPDVNARLANITTCHPSPCYLITVRYNFPLMNCSLAIICIVDKSNFDGPHWNNIGSMPRVYWVTMQLAPDVNARLANITTCHPLPCYLITVGYNFPLMNCSLAIICIVDKSNFDVMWAYLLPSLYQGNEVRPKTHNV